MPDDPVVTLCGMTSRDLVEAFDEGSLTLAEFAAAAERMESSLANAIAGGAA